MQRQKANSTDVKSYGYDPKKKLLEIEFYDGGVYQYPKVSKQRYKAFANSDSLGAYVNERLRDNYTAKKV